MKSRILAILVLGTLALAAVHSCSGDKNPTGSNPPPGGGTDTLATASDSARYVTLMAIDSVAQLNDGVTPESLATALLAFVSSRPEFEATGQQGTSVWARFNDHRMLMIPNNRFPDTGAVEAPPADMDMPYLAPPLPVGPLPPRKHRAYSTSASFVATSSIPTSPCGLPHSTDAALFQALGSSCYSLSRPFIWNVIKNSGYYWTVGEPSVNELAHVNNTVGVFHIDAHGGVCEAEDHTFITGVWTTTEYSVSNDASFRSLLDSAELVYMYARGELSTGGCGTEWRYAFTGKFVASFMSFPPNSIVYIGACYSDAPSLRNGFKAAGASVYCGWTQPVTDRQDNKSSEFLFERLAGSNASQLTPKEVPKQRPFDLANVHQDMIDRGLDFDLKTISELHITELNAGFGILSPSIRHAYVVPFTDTLFLTGFFGENPGSRGHVFVDGHELPIADWQPTFIWAVIPDIGPGWAGPMIVRVDRAMGQANGDRESNKVNLTGWEGNITYTKFEAGSLTGKIFAGVQFRADVHSFREYPHTTPAQNPLIYFGGDLTASMYGSATGAYVYVRPSTPPDPPEILTYTWGGETHDIYVPPTGTTTADPYGQYLLQGNIEPSDSLNLLFLPIVGGGGQPYEDLVSSEYGLQHHFDVPLSPPQELYENPTFATLRLALTSDWKILHQARTYNVCCSTYPTDATPPEIVHTMSWPEFTTSFPPDPNEAR